MPPAEASQITASQLDIAQPLRRPGLLRNDGGSMQQELSDLSGADCESGAGPGLYPTSRARHRPRPPGCLKQAGPDSKRPSSPGRAGSAVLGDGDGRGPLGSAAPVCPATWSCRVGNDWRSRCFSPQIAVSRWSVIRQLRGRPANRACWRKGPRPRPRFQSGAPARMDRRRIVS